MKAARPPVWSVSVRMSGVFGQKLGRKKWRTSVRLRPARARVVADEVVAAVRSWQTVADRYGLGRPQQQRMARAFRLADG
jgi:hypothetical protein